VDNESSGWVATVRRTVAGLLLITICVQSVILVHDHLGEPVEAVTGPVYGPLVFMAVGMALAFVVATAYYRYRPRLGKNAGIRGT
jgi:hypothetical protein